MKNQISKETILDLVKLGLYQVIGGLMGVFFIIWGIVQSLPFTTLSVLLYLFILSFFSYSIYAGILCLKTRKNALTHSLINQVLQLISVALLGFAFQYVAGAYFTIGLDLTESLNLQFGAGISEFDFSLNNNTDRLLVSVNLIALALIYWIDKLMKKVKEEAALRQVSAIGES
jgi:hypothetical protein